MLEARKVDNNKMRKASSVRYVSGTRYLENIPQVGPAGVSYSSVANK